MDKKRSSEIFVELNLGLCSTPESSRFPAHWPGYGLDARTAWTGVVLTGKVWGVMSSRRKVEEKGSGATSQEILLTTSFLSIEIGSLYKKCCVNESKNEGEQEK